MNFEFISFFESFSVRRFDFDGASLPVLDPIERPIQNVPTVRGYTVNWPWRLTDDVISPPSLIVGGGGSNPDWDWRVWISLSARIESKRKEFDEEKFKIFWTFQKIMRNHLWVIWWVILLLNLLVGDWWWIITMIRQLNCLIKSAEEQNS